MALCQASTEIVNALEGYITELHAEWKTLLELFGANEAQSSFLNNVAGALFDTIYRTLIRDVLLGIARLTDPLKINTAGQDNLVLERLTEISEVAGDASLKEQVSAKLSEVKVAAKPIRDYRHKYLAHLDLQASLKTSGDVLPGVKRQDVESVLALFAELLNLIEGPLRDRFVSFKDVAIHGGAQALLRNLEDAQALKQLPVRERYRLRRLAAAKADA